MSLADLRREIELAASRIYPVVQRTPLLHSPAYSSRLGANVYFKCENLQTTGSFKLRGATHRLLALDKQARSVGVIAASTGNHGRGVAHACRQLGMSCVIYAPQSADPNKLEAMRLMGAEVRVVGDDCLQAEQAARAAAEDEQRCYVSPYNDLRVAAGQGTVGWEIAEQLPQVDAAIIAVGGGGLISGVGSWLKHVRPECQIVGCSPACSDVMLQSLRAGRILDLPSDPTLSDATAGGVESGAVTFAWCQQLVDQSVDVAESEIKKALGEFIDKHSLLIEGAAAAAIAGLEQVAEQFPGANLVVVLCGANISSRLLAQALAP